MSINDFEADLSPEEQEWRHGKVWKDQCSINIPRTGIFMDWTVKMDAIIWARLDSLIRWFQFFLVPEYERFPGVDHTELALIAQDQSRGILISFFVDQHWVPLTEESQEEQKIINENIKEWFQNFGENLSMIRSEGKCISELEGKFESVVVIHDEKNIIKTQDTVICTSQVLKQCLELQIIPDFVITLDSIDVDPLIQKHMKDISLISITICDPNIKWEGDRYWFNPMFNEQYLPNVSHFLHLFSRVTTIETKFNIKSICQYFIKQMTTKKESI
jgi:hypothetical protein